MLLILMFLLKSYSEYFVAHEALKFFINFFPESCLPSISQIRKSMTQLDFVVQ